jgi:predicted Rossmann fold nucleotide-binding protein DprA/Smf involved in DNA uptake
MHIAAISGIRDLAESSYADVELAMLEEAATARELHFGGAIGVDTVALAAVCGVAIPRVVYVPFDVDSQPRGAAEVIRRCATAIHELRLRQGVNPYMQRNIAMCATATRLLAFTDGRQSGGTWNTIQYAKRRGLDVTIVQVIARGLSARNSR